jgi:hypothetical protein
MKRSSQVALLLMGVAGAGASAYALFPQQDCVAPEKPAAISPGTVSPQTLAPGVVRNANPTTPCSSTRRSYWGRRYLWSSGSDEATRPSRRSSVFSPSTNHTSVPSVGRSSGWRGGFGSFGHSIGLHFSGG